MHEVILKKDIYKLGERGEVVKVKDGFARNYLFPQGLAIPADEGSLKQLEQMQAAAAKEAVQLRGEATKQLDALEGVVVRMIVRASLNNQLYGSVTARDIAASLAEQGFVVERQRIQLTKPIRDLGDYDVPIHIYKELATTIKVEVRAEGREDEPLTQTTQPSEEFEFAPPIGDPESEEGEQGEGAEAEAGAEGESPADAEASGEEAPSDESAAEESAAAETAAEESPGDEPPAGAAAGAEQDDAPSPAGEDATAAEDAAEASDADGA